MSRFRPKTLAGIIFSVLSLMPQAAFAYDWYFEGYVTIVEPSYVPSHIVFQTDNGAGTCPAGTFLNWFAKGGDAAAKAYNVQAVLSVLLTAQVTHRKVRIHGNNQSCSVDYIHFL